MSQNHFYKTYSRKNKRYKFFGQSKQRIKTNISKIVNNYDFSNFNNKNLNKNSFNEYSQKLENFKFLIDLYEKIDQKDKNLKQFKVKYIKFNEKKESFKKSVKSRKEALDKHRKRLINKICKFFVLISLFLVNSIISFSALTDICFVLSKVPRILSIVISTALSLLLDSVIYLQPINFNINKILLFISIPSMVIGIFLAYSFKEKCLN